MEIEKQVLIPERVMLGLDTQAWERLPRQVYWLSSGARDTGRIAQLLHKSAAQIVVVASNLQMRGYVKLRIERKVLTMNPALLKESFELINSRTDAFAHAFYDRLFRDYPATVALFANTDMARQRGSLMATLAFVVAGVNRGENLVGAVQDLGERHVRHGAQPEHYPLVGAVLIQTFHDFLGMRFTEEMEQSWEEAYEVISAQMQVGAARVAP